MKREQGNLFPILLPGMINEKFTYDNYNEICAEAKKTGRVFTYAEATLHTKFLILRHDIEFSVQKALRMAEIEASHGLKATYFVQLGNNAYNALSDENTAILREIHGMGHDIGLHYRQNATEDPVMQILSQSTILSEVTGAPIETFSCHRPKEGYESINVPGMINAYARPFFYKTDSPENAKTRYIADSKYRWPYGSPATAMKCKRVQLLIHPFQWAETDRSLAMVFRDLLRENSRTQVQTYNREFQRFAEVRNQFG